MKTQEKGLALLLVLSLCLTVIVRPFSIYAYTGDNISLTDVMIGYNIYPVQIYEDHEYQLSLSAGSGTFTQTQGSITLAPFTYNNQTYYSSATGQGQMNQSGTLSMNMSSTSTARVWYKGLYRLEIVFDQTYVGSMEVNVDGAGYSTLVVNGNTLSTNFVLNTQVTNTSDWSVTLAIRNVNLKVGGDDIMWQYPAESFGSIYYLFSQGFTDVGINQYNSSLYPIFNSDTSNFIARGVIAAGAERTIVLILYNSSYGASQSAFATDFTYNADISAFRTVVSNTGFRILTITFKNNTSSGFNLSLKFNTADIKFCVVYNNAGNLNTIYPITTDFALEFGLQNQVINNLNIIANGTNASNTSASNLNNSKSDFNNTVSDYQNLENDFNDNFDNAMQNINIAPISDMGSKFLSSASWVRTQFDNIVNNTPYGSVLGFSLILGFSLLIIGKVYK